MKPIDSYSLIAAKWGLEYNQTISCNSEVWAVEWSLLLLVLAARRLVSLLDEGVTPEKRHAHKVQPKNRHMSRVFAVYISETD